IQLANEYIFRDVMSREEVVVNPYVGGMALMRVISGALELTAAVLMARSNQIDTALRLNGLLGLVGPAMLVIVSMVGLVGLASEISPMRTLMILMGVFFIFL